MNLIGLKATMFKRERGFSYLPSLAHLIFTLKYKFAASLNEKVMTILLFHSLLTLGDDTNNDKSCHLGN